MRQLGPYSRPRARKGSTLPRARENVLSPPWSQSRAATIDGHPWRLRLIAGSGLGKIPPRPSLLRRLPRRLRARRRPPPRNSLRAHGRSRYPIGLSAERPWRVSTYGAPGSRRNLRPASPPEIGVHLPAAHGRDEHDEQRFLGGLELRPAVPGRRPRARRRPRRGTTNILPIQPPPGLSAADRAEFLAGRTVIGETGCLACHRIGITGNNVVGPNLTHIGSVLAPSAIRSTLVNATPPMPSFRGLPRGKPRAVVYFLSKLQ